MGKTTVAFALAKAMKFCLVCKDDVREAALRHDAQVLAEIREKCGEHASEIRVDSNDMTYEAMFAVGITQLRVGVAGVVLESPLGRVALGERAVSIAREAQAFCVLVDCYAERSIWEQRLAARIHENEQHSILSGDNITCHAKPKPSNADEIVRHYTDMQYKMECDAHVRVDCGLSPDDNVKTIQRVIKQLLAEEL